MRPSGFNGNTNSTSSSKELYNSQNSNKSRNINTQYERDERENRLSQKVGLLKQVIYILKFYKGA